MDRADGPEVDRVRAEAVTRPLKIDLMFPTKHTKVFSKPRWFFEEKYDGWRLLARKTESGNTFLRTRKGHDVTQLFLDLADPISQLPCRSCVLDGELVARDFTRRVSLAALNERARKSRNRVPGAEGIPVHLMAFDLLECDGVDLRMEPLWARKKHLWGLLVKQADGIRIQYVPHLEEEGKQFWEHVLVSEAEGMVCKRSGSSYRGGKSKKWLKIKPRYLGSATQ